MTYHDRNQAKDRFPDRATPLKVTVRNVNGQQFRDVAMMGQLNSIVGGTLAEAIPLEIDMTFLKGFSSPANPYGFTLTAYHEKQLVKPGSNQP